MSAILSPPPVRGYRPDFLPAYLSNGLLGLRAGRIPLRVRPGSGAGGGHAALPPRSRRCVRRQSDAVGATRRLDGAAGRPRSVGVPFERGYAEFIDEPWRVANEFSLRLRDQVRAGPLVANMGGFLTSCLYGLTGLVLGPEEPATWARRPAVMPSLWDAIEVERVWVRGMRMIAEHGATARFEPLPREPLRSRP